MAASKPFSFADVIILLFLGSSIYGVVFLAQQWNGSFLALVEIDLSISSLPLYGFFSFSRGLIAYMISLVFALVYGYIAAKVRGVDRFLIPLLDILQCIPVLGFLPGLVLGLIAIFPKSNIGLELAAILMIFTSQAWNMAFSFYASLRTVPSDLQDVTLISKLTPMRRLFRLELPHSAIGLVWNSVMSMAGGWFFLTVCESFTLGDRPFRLPGLGAYMAMAIEKGNKQAMFFGVITMVSIIVVLDFIIWRPVLVWVQRFRFDHTNESVEVGHSFMLQLFQDSKILSQIQSFLKLLTEENLNEEKRHHRFIKFLRYPFVQLYLGFYRGLLPQRLIGRFFQSLSTGMSREFLWSLVSLAVMAFLIFLYLIFSGSIQLYFTLSEISFKIWFPIIRDAFYTLLRVFTAVFLSTLWTVPVGVAIGLSPRATRILQPVIQVIAAFPSPMIYPLVLGALIYFGVSLEFGSVILMMLGVQWYILFNVLAGAMGISQDLQANVELAQVPASVRWKKLYLPGIFPSLVVGWITAAGGAWNACIITEYFRYQGHLYTAHGVGSAISRAAERGEFSVLAASLVVIIIAVVLLNRLLWQPLSEFAEKRFSLQKG